MISLYKQAVKSPHLVRHFHHFMPHINLFYIAPSLLITHPMHRIQQSTAFQLKVSHNPYYRMYAAETTASTIPFFYHSPGWDYHRLATGLRLSAMTNPKAVPNIGIARITGRMLAAKARSVEKAILLGTMFKAERVRSLKLYKSSIYINVWGLDVAHLPHKQLEKYVQHLPLYVQIPRLM